MPFGGDALDLIEGLDISRKGHSMSRGSFSLSTRVRPLLVACFACACGGSTLESSDDNVASEEQALSSVADCEKLANDAHKKCTDDANALSDGNAKGKAIAACAKAHSDTKALCAKQAPGRVLAPPRGSLRLGDGTKKPDAASPKPSEPDGGK